MKHKKDNTRQNADQVLLGILKTLSDAIKYGEQKEQRIKTTLEEHSLKKIIPRKSLVSGYDNPSFSDFYKMFAYDLAKPGGLWIPAIYSFILITIAFSFGIINMSSGIRGALLLYILIIAAIFATLFGLSFIRTWKYQQRYKKLSFRITGLHHILRTLGNDQEKYILCRISVSTRDIVLLGTGYIPHEDEISQTIQGAVIRLISLEGNKYFYRANKEFGEWNEWSVESRTKKGDIISHITGYVNQRLTAKIVKLLLKKISHLQSEAGFIEKIEFTDMSRH